MIFYGLNFDMFKQILMLSLGTFSMYGVAAEIQVAAGVGTLQTAINGAQADDVLVLESGNYTATNDQFTLDKPLTIRAASSASLVNINASFVSHPHLSEPLSFMRFQGVNINGPHWCLGSSGIAFKVDNLSFLETSMSCSNSAFVATDKILLVDFSISNSFGSVSLQAPNVQAFGSTFSTRSGLTINGSDVSFIGNMVISYNANATDFSGSQPGGKLIAANRFYYRLTEPASYNYDSISSGRTINLLSIYSTNTNKSYLKNNLFKIDLTHFSGFDDAGTLEHIALLRGSSSGTSLNSYFYNNLIDTVGLDIKQKADGVTDLGPMIINELAAFENNIVVNYNDDLVADNAKATVKYNLGFNNAAEFDSNADNINADPLFNTDYVLNPNSPAIDSGSPGLQFSDIDMSRNDIGIYGGSWRIDQYDAQRADHALGPFVYPVIEAQSSVVNGELKLKFVSYPRLK